MTTEQHIWELNESVFDALADGELSLVDRRQLLTACEAEPDGWRRCTLAFLEAQAWHCELAGLAETTRKPSAANAMTESGSLTSKLLSVAAVAAGLFIAFGLGFASKTLPFGRPSGSSDAPSVAIVNIDDQSQVGSDDLEPFADVEQVADTRERIPFVVHGEDGGVIKEFDLPIHDQSDIEAWQQTVGQSSVPIDWIDNLKKLGHRIERQRRYVPYDLQDGRRLIVPIDEVNIIPVSQTVYH